ncbi:MAG: LptF/LptG family permease [Chitinophagaceae bacterium]|nr:LptF/LptG family permease [Chitinophagaceae bacterium]MCW5904301.1 LptF/LptG family permease [Chitinophagaceae bacterium]
MKKLDTLILRSFIGPFFATFFISLFVLVMQFFWLYIDDLVGKGLDILVIVKLIVYVSTTLIPLALPLAMLLSSIMTFGNLGETFELVAIKSAGISLSRFMRPLFLTAILIGGIAFVFSNNIIPIAQLKLASLKYDIIVAKPAFDIKEGMFYNQIKDFSIKIGKKEKNDSTIRNIVIFEKRYNQQDNVLIADSGTMRVTPDKKFLEFILKDGWRYEEKGQRYSSNTDYIRLGFKEYKKVFDLSAFQMNETSDSSFKYDPKMLSIRQLNTTLDSFDRGNKKMFIRSNQDIASVLYFTKYADSVTTIQSSTQFLGKTNSFTNIIPDSLKAMVYDNANGQLHTVKNITALQSDEYLNKQKTFRQHEIEWHRKFTLSIACIVLFLIGAPLGSIIRKGGLGMPLVFSIIFFIIFHLFNTFGEKMTKESVVPAYIGMWLSTIILIPIGVFLTYKAMRDSQLFNKEFYYRAFKAIRNFLATFKNSKYLHHEEQ